MKYRIEKQPERNIRKEISIVRKISLLLMGAVLILAAGCVKDDLHNTPHPDKGAVTVTTDWSHRSSDATVPESYVLRIGDKEQTVSGATNAFTSLFLSGRQDLLIFHQAEGITLSGTTATVNALSGGTLEPMPGCLFSGTAELKIVEDDTLRITVPMQQHTRRLTLTLKLNPGDEQRITRTSATLTGIASAIDLTTGAITSTDGKVVIPAFALGTDKETRATGQPILIATLRLLGVIAAEKQVLTLAVTLTDGHVEDITTDLTEALKHFDTGEDMEPLTLDATLTLPVEAGMSGTITGWTEVDNGNIDIH